MAIFSSTVNTKISPEISSEKIAETPQQLLKKRIAAIDILRGFVMLLMLVDHVRERFFYHHVITDPMTIDETSTSLFFTRMTAHLCAPVFVFLTGLSAWLYAHPHNKAPRSASMFLFKRGLFIILIECTLINFSWFGYYEVLYLQVMWAIGVSMIALAIMVKTPYWFIGLLGATIVFGHNALAPISFSPDEFGYTLWTILHDRGFLISEGIIKVKASYPVLPWIGVILLGYFAGPLYSSTINAVTRQKSLLILSLLCFFLLFVLRYFNLYGETLAWQTQANTIDTIKAFVNYTKYPPSLNYILLTLGVAFTLLTLFEKVNNKASQIIEGFGAAPMFFYILHLYVILIGYKICMAIFGSNQGDLFGVEHTWQVWFIALLLAFALYFPTMLFARFKQKSTMGWTKYF